MPTTPNLGLPVPADDALVADTPQHIGDLADALDTLLGGPWTAYVPTWTGVTNPVLNDGTLTGEYRRIGTLIEYRIRLLCGASTTYGTGSFVFSLPVASALTAYSPLGQAVIRDVSVPIQYPRTAYQVTTTTIALVSEAGAHVNATAPMTFAAGDIVTIAGRYRAAA